MADVIRDLWVCVDCLMFHANGDLPDDPEAEAAIIAGCEREAPYVWTCDGPNTVDCGGGIECVRCDGTGEIDTDDSDEPSACPDCDGGGRVDEPEDADTQEFSWSECDCCQSTLGGSRHRMALIKHD